LTVHWVVGDPSAKSAESAPMIEKLEIVKLNGALPLLANVTVCAVDGTPTVSFPKAMLVWESDGSGLEAAVIARALTSAPKPTPATWPHESVPGSAKTTMTGVVAVSVRRSSAKIVAVNSVEETNVVGRLLPVKQLGVLGPELFH